MHLVHSRSKFDATWLACAFLAGIPGCGAAADSPAGEIGVAQDALSIGAPIIGLANKCIAVSATNDLTPSGNRRVYLRTCNGASTQNWKRLNNSTIQNTGTGLCLNAENGGTGNLTNLIAYQCSSTPLPNEKWIMKQSGTALQAWMIQGVGSGRCVNVPGGNTADKTGLVLYTCQNQSNDRWVVTEPAPLVGNAGKCVDIGADQRRVVLNTCNGTPQQDWYSNSQAQLVNSATGLCMNVENGAITTDGAAVIVYPCSATALSNEIWANQAAGTNLSTPIFQVRVNGNGKCLNVPNAARADQTGLIIYTCTANGLPNDTWSRHTNFTNIVRVAAFALSNDDGSNPTGITLDQMSAALDAANGLYARAGIQFYLYAFVPKRSTLLNTIGVSSATAAQEQAARQLAANYAGAVPILLRNNPGGFSSYGATTDYIAIPSGSVDARDLTHELGHYFGLIHPFWDDALIQDPKNIANAYTAAAASYHAHGSTFDGDGLLDTPPDPGESVFALRDGNNVCLGVDNSALDQISVPDGSSSIQAYPDRRNAMSYFKDCPASATQQTLTAQQIGRIRSTLASGFRTQLAQN